MSKSSMREGSGRIYSKSPVKTKHTVPVLSEITNNPHLRSIVSTDKGDNLTQVDSCSEKSGSRWTRTRNNSEAYL